MRLDSANQRALAGSFDPDLSFSDLARQAPYFGFVEVRIPGAAPFLMFSNNDDVVAQHYLYRKPGFEAASLRLWVALARRARAVVDGGAFTGVFSLAARSANPDVRVWAFEPASSTFGRLATNIWANRFDASVAPVMAALGDRGERARLRHPFGLYVLGSGESFLAERVRDSWYEEDVQVIAGDQFEVIRQASPLRFVINQPFEQIDLIKLDVEGYEPRVLQGMRETIAASRPTLILEFRDAPSLHAIREQLPPGARVFFIDDETLALRGEPCDFKNVDHQNLLVVLRDDLDLEALCVDAGVFFDASPSSARSPTS